MFRKVVNLILTGGKTEKNIDHCRCMGLVGMNLDEITDSHLVDDFRIKTFQSSFVNCNKHAIMNELWVKF